MDLYTLVRFGHFALPFSCGVLFLKGLLYGLMGDWFAMPVVVIISAFGMLVWFGTRKYLP